MPTRICGEKKDGEKMSVSQRTAIKATGRLLRNFTIRTGFIGRTYLIPLFSKEGQGKILFGIAPAKKPPQSPFKKGGRRNRAHIAQFLPLITRCTAPGKLLSSAFIAFLLIVFAFFSAAAEPAAAGAALKMECFGAGWRQKPWVDRLEPAPAKLLEYLAYQNKQDGFSEVPVAVTPVPEIAGVIKKTSFSLSPALNKLLNERLIGVFLVNDLGSSGFAEEVVDEGSRISYAIIVLDRDVFLKRKANAWATWKENSIFQPQKDPRVRLQMIIESGKENTVQNAVHYLLLHELGHVLGMLSQVHPSWMPADKPLSLDYPFVQFSWKQDEKGKPVSLFDEKFSERKSIHYYAFGKAQLTYDQAPDVYNKLQSTNFVSMQASSNLWDDFAESFVTYVHVLREKKVWQVRIENGKNKTVIIKSCWQEKRCAQKKKFLDRWFNNPL
jgi:hypothetical protein